MKTNKTFVGWAKERSYIYGVNEARSRVKL